MNEELFALSGDERTHLPMGRYCWHIRPGTGPSEAKAQFDGILRLVLGPVGFVLILAVAPEVLAALLSP